MPNNKTLPKILKQNNQNFIIKDLINYYESSANLPKLNNFKALTMTYRIYNKLTIKDITKIYENIKANIPKPIKMFKSDFYALKRKIINSKLLKPKFEELKSKLNKGLLVLIDKKTKINEEIKDRYEESIKNNKNFNFKAISFSYSDKNDSKQNIFNKVYDINYYNKDFSTSYQWRYKLIGFHDLRTLEKIAKKYPDRLNLEVIESFNNNFKLDNPKQPKNVCRYFYCTSNAYYLNNEDFSKQLNKIKHNYVKSPRKKHLIAYRIKDNTKSLEELIIKDINQRYKIYDFDNLDRHIIYFNYPKLFNIKTLKHINNNKKSIKKLYIDSLIRQKKMRSNYRKLTKFLNEFTFIVEKHLWINRINAKRIRIKKNIYNEIKLRKSMKEEYVNLIKEFYRDLNKTIEIGDLIEGNNYFRGFNYDIADILVFKLFNTLELDNYSRQITFEGNLIEYNIKKHEKFNLFFYKYLKNQYFDFNELDLPKDLTKELKSYLEDKALSLNKYPQVKKYFNKIYQFCFNTEEIRTIKISNF